MGTAYRIPDTAGACVPPGTAAKSTVPIGRFNVRSFITSHADGATIPAGRETMVRGIAFDGGAGIAACCDIRIGTAAALRARAFGMQVAFYDPSLPNGAELAFGFTRALTLAGLLGLADVVTIHAPLNDATRAMIDASAVAAMKPGAYLINTARGPICDTAALLEGLKSGKLAAVGLDVLPHEPATLNDPLVAAWRANEPWIRGRMLLNPHAGFFSPDAFVDLRRKAIETAYYYLRDGKLANCVNAEFLKQRR